MSMSEPTTIEKIENNLSATFLPNAVSYKFWHSESKEMGNVVSIKFNEVGIPNAIRTEHGNSDILQWYHNGVLIPSTGLYDKHQDELYMGDIVMCYFIDDVYKDRVVFWDNGWRVMGATTDEFKTHSEELVSRVGNIWEDTELYKMYTEKYNDKIKSFK